MTLLSKFYKKKVLILGAGEEGLDSLSFFKQNIDYSALGVADKLSFDDFGPKTKQVLKSGVTLHLGRSYLAAVKDYDVIVKSPGIPLSALKIDKHQVLTSQSDIFLSNCKGNIIGITGTKGKSTTAHLIYNLLKNNGFSAQLVGNIGMPALSFLKDSKRVDFFVYELSSFQLATIKKSPHIAIILNIFKDHLDNHTSFKEYMEAKAKITEFQKKEDFLIYDKDNEYVRIIAERSIAKKIPFDSTKREKGIMVSIEPIIYLSELLKIKKDIYEKTITEFGGLPHRTEFLGRYQGISFYNDSAATIPEATINAINSLKNIQTLVVGGVDKGGDYPKLIDALKESDIQNIVIFKGSPKDFEKGITELGKIVFYAGDMKEAVQHCFNNTTKEKSCLLSPGFASFNMFKNYKERGELFKRYVREQGKT